MAGIDWALVSCALEVDTESAIAAELLNILDREVRDVTAADGGDRAKDSNRPQVRAV